MPNWCLNKLTVSHDDQNLVDKFIREYDAGRVCQVFVPEPENIGDDELHGWRVSNWGTKWDIGADIGSDIEEQYGDRSYVNQDGSVSCSFNSAWSPPVGLYNALVDLGFSVNATYFEPGMSYCGVYTEGYDDMTEYGHHDEIPDEVKRDFHTDEFYESVVDN